MALARELGGVISGEHGIGITKLEFLTDDELAPFADYKRRVDPEGRFNRGKLLRSPALPADLTNAYTPCFALIGHESLILEQSEIGGDRRLDQGLPALRQVQAGLRDARAARQPALQPAQQDPRHVAPDRGLPLRGADAPRRVAAALRRVRRRRRPLHRLPQVRQPVPGRHRLRRRVDRDAQPAARGGQSEVPAGNGRRDVLPDRDRSGDDQAREEGDDRLGLPGAAPRACGREAHGARARADAASAGDDGRDRRSRRRSSTSSTSRCRRACPKRTARALLDIEDDAIVPIIRDPAKVERRRGRGVLFPGLRLGAPVLAGRPRDAGDALPRRRAMRAAAGLPLLRLSADGGGQPRQGPARSSPTTACCSIASPTRSTTSTSGRSSSPAAPAWTSCRNTSSTRSSRAAACSTSTSTCSRKAWGSRASTGVRYMYHDPCHTPMKTYQPLEVVNDADGRRRSR